MLTLEVRGVLHVYVTPIAYITQIMSHPVWLFVEPCVVVCRTMCGCLSNPVSIRSRYLRQTGTIRSLRKRDLYIQLPKSAGKRERAYGGMHVITAHDTHSHKRIPNR
jgi:hypothetical protein